MAKKIVLVIIFISLIVSLQFIKADYSSQINNSINDNFPFIERNLMASNRYTNVETKDELMYQEYLDNFTLKYTEDELYVKNYTKIGENNELILYFHPTSFSIIVHNKATNYQWSSRAEFIEDGEANRAKLNEMQSGLWVEYVMAANVTKKTLMSNVLDQKANINYNIIPNQVGFIASVNFMALGFDFDVSVTLEDNQLKVFIDHTKIEEKLPRYRLIGLQIFPYLGAARQNKFPGYMFIPDGVGALVRFKEKLNTFYLARYYGDDYGYSRTTVNRKTLSLPVFGMVHDVDKNGFIGIIKSGDTMAYLGAYFWGHENSNYYRTSPRYYYREIYTNVIDKSGSGSETISENIKPIDIDVRYNFLSNNDANYVGMAKSYQQSLNDVFKVQNESENIPLAVDYLMSEQEPSFLGTKTVKMTTPADVIDIYNQLSEKGINNQVVNLLGWSTSGFVDTAPYEVKYSDSKREYLRLIENIPNLYFYTDYMTATESSSRIDYGDDVARQMSKMKMEINQRIFFFDDEIRKTYYLYPKLSLNMALGDKNAYNNLGIKNLSYNSVGNTLFSYYEKGLRYNRSDSLNFYQQIFESYDNQAFYNPNAYAFKYTNQYLNMPLYTSGHNYFTDLVPFLPIVLKGKIEYYSPYLNFNSLGKDQILNLIDFAINPSYLLTKEPTTKMRYTKASIYFSTEYKDYQNEIINTYNYINDALKGVHGATIVSRQVLADGVVKVSYSNNKVIYINYTSSQYQTDGITISAKDYVVR